MKLLGVTQAAERLGVVPRRVLQFIHAGRLPAQRIGKQWVIRETDVETFQQKPAGRPPKD